MMATPSPVTTDAARRPREGRGAVLRLLLIGAISFLMLVDLFAAPALLPALVRADEVSPATMGVAINASTFGMAAAFALTLGHLTEGCRPTAATAALAAYVTGNVASQLVGRIAASSLAGSAGLASTFAAFAALNLLGAKLAWQDLARARLPHPTMMASRPGRELLRPALRRGHAVGFLILVALIGTSTSVNDVLVHAPLAIAPMALGLVHLAFIPALRTTPLAGRAAARHGPARAASLGLIVAVVGAPLLLVGQFHGIRIGFVLVGAGTFVAQAVATGSVGQLAGTSRAAAGALCLAAYYRGGLAGRAAIGHVEVKAGWPAAVAGIGLALLLAIPLARALDGQAEARG